MCEGLVIYSQSSIASNSVPYIDGDLVEGFSSLQELLRIVRLEDFHEELAGDW